MVMQAEQPTTVPPVAASSEDVVLSVNDVSKKFCRDLRKSLFYGVQDILSDLTGGRPHSERLRPKEFWALQDITFDLHRGEALGLIGANGAGKSTLLRILSGLIKPDQGSVRVKGRLAPLIALGAGFNPILTGRENIYANMSVLGLSTREIEDRFEAVVDFAEITEAIDAPVQTYSSGMAARLGFACAIHTEPDILLIDEVLAVGDIRFRAKCTRKLAEIRQKGTAFILVNHKPAAILSICDQAVYLQQGRVLSAGDTNWIVRQYEEDLMLKDVGSVDNQIKLPPKAAHESSGIEITYALFRDEWGQAIASIYMGQSVYCCLGLQVRSPFQGIYWKCKISDLSRESETVLDLNSDYDGCLFDVTPGNQEMQVKLPTLGLRPGVYTMDIYVVKKPQHCFDIVKNFKFKVEIAPDAKFLIERNLYYQQREWSLRSC